MHFFGGAGDEVEMWVQKNECLKGATQTKIVIKK
jgi:hypothetical protein